MPPAPLTAALLTGATGTLGLIHLALDPVPYADERALLIAAGMAVLTLVVMAGILLARGRWSRWTLLALGTGWVGLAARAEFDPLSLAVLGGGAAMLAIAAGPWLPRWLRHRPSSEGPPPAAVLLLVTLLGWPVLIGVLATEPGAPEWAGAGWALILCGGLARALPPMLWAGRLLHLPMAILVGIAIDFPAGLAMIGVGAFQTGLMWRRDLHLSVSPLVPAPATAVPIPRELVDPAILRAAGLDDRGRPLEDT